MHIRDITDINLIDLIILQELMTYRKPVTRYILFDRVKALINEKKKIFPSRFYKDLDQLEQKGYILAEKNDVGKILHVSPSKKAHQALSVLMRFILFDNVVFLQDVSNEEILSKLSLKPPYPLSMSVWYTDRLYLESIEVFRSISPNHNYLMNQIEVDHQLGQKLEKEGIQQVHIINQKIREPDDIYDLIIFVFFSKKLLFQNMTPEEVLSECYRILKPGGTLFISVLPKLEKNNSPMLTKFIAFFEDLFFDWLFTSAELEDILIKNGFIDIKMFIHPERIFCSAMKKIG